MADLISEVNETYRDFVTDGVPASGANEPDKAEIRTLLINMATAISASQQGMTAYATAADLPTDPVPTEGTQARVYADSTDSNNGVWLYSGGAWAFDTDYYNAIVSVVQPIADDAAASAASILQARPGTGEHVNIEGGDFTAQSGAAFLNNAQGIRSGWSIPDGSTGANSIAAKRNTITGPVAARYAGATIRVKAVAAITGYSTISDLNLAALDAYVIDYAGAATGGSTSAGGTVVRNEIAGGYLYREVEIALTSTMRSLGVVFRLGAAALASGARTLKIVSTSLTCTAVPNGAAYTAADVTAALLNDGKRRSIGPVFELLTARSAIAAGATLTGDYHIAIPNGSSGNGSIARGDLDVSAIASIFNGCTAVLTIGMNHSTTFTRTIAAQLEKNFAGNVGALGIEALDVTPTYREYYVTLSLDTAMTTISPKLVQSNAANTAADEYYEMISATIEIVGAPNGYSAAQVNERVQYHRAVNDAVGQSALSLGDILATVTPAVQLLNGATALGDWGFTIPNGSSGYQSLIQAEWAFDGAAYAGCTIRVVMPFAVSANFDRTLVGHMQVATAASPGGETRAAAIGAATVGNNRIYTIDYVVQGDETDLRPYVQVANPNTAVAADETIELLEFIPRLISTTSAAGTVQDENARLLTETIGTAALNKSATILRPTFAETIMVKAVGGDFDNLADAIAAVDGASIAKQYKIAWDATAVLGTPELVIPPWTAIICLDPQADAVMSFANANDASAATITNTSLLWFYYDGSVVEGGTWEITNGRYVFHGESNGLRPNSEQRIIGVKAVHHGNADAVNNTWAVGSQFALGCGISEGQTQQVIDCDLSAPGGGYSCHSPNHGTGWSTPFLIDLSGCRFEATDASRKDLYIKPIAAGPGRARVRGCSYDELSYIDTEWLGGDPGAGVNTAQIAVAGSGNRNLAGDAAPAFVNEIAFGNATGKAYAGLWTGA